MAILVLSGLYFLVSKFMSTTGRRRWLTSLTPLSLSVGSYLQLGLIVPNHFCEKSRHVFFSSNNFGVLVLLPYNTNLLLIAGFL